MSALDTLLNDADIEDYYVPQFVEQARAELSRLRLAAAEADALQAERDQYAKDFVALMERIAHLDDMLNDTDECEAWDGCADIAEQFDPWESIRVMVETAKTLRSTVAAQARQLEQMRDEILSARFILDLIAPEHVTHVSLFVKEQANTWLAANAPEAEAEEATK